MTLPTGPLAALLAAAESRATAAGWALLAKVRNPIDVAAIEQWIAYGGPPMIFGLLFACGLGLPLPEDLPLLAGGYFIGSGTMHPVPVCTLAWLGIVGGDCMLYRLGRKYGLNITKVPVIGRHVTQERILRAERLFDRWGVWVVAVGRLVAGIRGAMVVAAGATKFNFVKFLIADGIAALVSGGLFVALGWWLSRFGNFQDVVRIVEPRVKTFVYVLLAVAALWLLYVWWAGRRQKAVTDVALKAAVAVADKQQPPPAPTAGTVAE
jgi:membrane protein DedA with SNARE-associated domain